jgi:hypothetical protein
LARHAPRNGGLTVVVSIALRAVGSQQFRVFAARACVINAKSSDDRR